jgi:hypothetical protein
MLAGCFPGRQLKVPEVQRKGTEPLVRSEPQIQSKALEF